MVSADSALSSAVGPDLNGGDDAVRKRSWVLSAEWRLVLPLGLFYSLFLLAPIGIIAFVSLFTDRSLREFSLVQYTTFFTERLNYLILLDTLRLGLVTTVVCLFLAFPLALAFHRVGRRAKRLLLFLLILPQLTSAVVRTFAWIVILGREGIIDRSLLAIGLAPAGLLYTTPGVVLEIGR